MTTKEAMELLALDKYYEATERLDFPLAGKKIEFPLFSRAPREGFLLSAFRGGIVISKCTFQTRTHKDSIILARLDIDGSPHRNPDGTVIEGTHLHLYNEQYNDKVAIPVPEIFTNTSDLFLTLDQFMDYCHVVKKPMLNRTLF